MNNHLNKVYLEKFWVGLIDGNGSLQVNHWKRKYLNFRAVINLKNTEKNSMILKQIQSVLGGQVYLDIKSDKVRWTSNHKKNMNHLLRIFDRYPPITHRLLCQVRFVKKCIAHMNVDQYIEERSLKYENPPVIIFQPLPSYFSAWLSGFIEAEGCFCIRKNGGRSFSIGQKNEANLLFAILDYFHAPHIKIQKRKDQMLAIEFYNQTSFNIIHQHFTQNPLLGEKQLSYLRTFPNIEGFHQFNL